MYKDLPIISCTCEGHSSWSEPTTPNPILALTAINEVPTLSGPERNLAIVATKCVELSIGVEVYAEGVEGELTFCAYLLSSTGPDSNCLIPTAYGEHAVLVIWSYGCPCHAPNGTGAVDFKEICLLPISEYDQSSHGSEGEGLSIP